MKFKGFVRKELLGMLLLLFLFKESESETTDIYDGNNTTVTSEDIVSIAINYSGHGLTTNTTLPPQTPLPPQQGGGLPLVLCQCGAGEVLDATGGQCQTWMGGTTVPTEDLYAAYDYQDYGPSLQDTKDFDVEIREPQCEYHQINIIEGQFTFRLRGDATDVLVKEGDYRGLRLADYCIHHQLDGDTRVKVTARGCVSRPIVPRCCQNGTHVLNEKCVSTTIESVAFNPPVATGPHGEKKIAGAQFPWTDIEEDVDMPSCEPGYVMKKIKLDGRKAYSFALPRGVSLIWLSEGDEHKYSFPGQFCIDIPEDGVTYYAYTCQWDLKTYCMTEICSNYTNKCCPEGEALHRVYISCVPIDVPFKSPFPSSSNLTTLYGYPHCNAPGDITDPQLSEDDTLIYNNNVYSMEYFCTDTFIGDDNSVKLGALACHKDIEKTYWQIVKERLIPFCLMLSLGFLALLILLYAWVPKLKEDEGTLQFFHAASLFLAFSVTLVLQYLDTLGIKTSTICMSSAFVMQFAFLSAFFWVNCLCFDVWRIFRNLLIHNCSPAPVAAWKYIIYAIGVPLIITVITIICQYVADNDVSIPWFIHPQINESRCWFPSKIEMLVYFYAPTAILFLLNIIFIGTTYHYIRIIHGTHTAAIDQTENTEASAENKIKTDNLAMYRQRFYLLALVAGLWLTDILSLIPPEELWAITDVINSLQGVFIFFIFLSEQNKRDFLKKELPTFLTFSNILIDQTNAAQINIPNEMRSKKTTKDKSSTSDNLTGNEEDVAAEITPLSLNYIEPQ